MATAATNPIHDVDFEAAVLGAVLAGAKMPDLDADAFYHNQHRLVFSVCQQLADSGSPINETTVIRHLRTSGTLDKAGGSLPLVRVNRLILTIFLWFVLTTLVVVKAPVGQIHSIRKPANTGGRISLS